MLGSSGSGAAGQLSYAKCMQTHGEPGFPEPEGNGQTNINLLKKLDPSSPQFQTAQKACEQALSKGESASPGEREKVLAQALKFAQCMQAHGMSNWPDPSANGYMVAPVGSAAESPTYLKASKICKPLLPSG
jgi:hypothetical protein